MKKLLLLTTVAITLSACGHKTGVSAGETDSAATDTIQAEAVETYLPQRADYTFRSEVRTINDDGDVRWDTIVVYLTDAQAHTQRLYTQALPLDTTQWNKGSIGEISEDDWNFDGVPDLQVCTGPMNGFGNYTYEVWIWDDNARRFELLKYDGEIYSPHIDTVNKRIVSVWRLDDDVEIVRYQWKDGKLVESERESMSYGDLAED